MLLQSLLAWRGRPFAAALCAALAASDCATYAPRTGPPGAVLARERSHAVRVSLRDGRTIEVLEPALRVDSAATGADTVLAGFAFDARRGRRTPIALPLRDVVRVSARVADHRANGAIAIVMFLGPVAVVLLVLGVCGSNKRGCFD